MTRTQPLRLVLKSAIVAILASLCLSAFAQSVVLMPITAAWRYNTNNLSATNWTAPSYDDSSWPGPGAALLYIEGTALPVPKNTPLPERIGGGPMNTYYFRSSMVVTNLSELTALTFSNLIDDGVVFYLNGVEVQRIGMAAGAVSYSTFASRSVSNAIAYDVFTLSGTTLTNLVEGTNIIAAEVHQVNAISSDIVFGSAVSAVYGSAFGNLIRGPYLQLSSPTNIVIRWRTDTATDSRVVYGTNAGSLVLTNSDPTPVVDHEITLANLQPDTTYFYAIGTAATNLAGPGPDHFFLTHPWPGTEKPIRVWVVGDAGTANASQQAVRDAFYNFNGTNTVHAWLQLGDNAYDNGTDAQYQAAVFNMYSALLQKSVTWPTLGNHDTDGSSAHVTNYPYFSMFTLPTNGAAGGVPSVTEHYYSFDLGMVHFICLDSMTASRATNGAMAIWLRSDLAMNTNRWTVAFWHHPPYSRGSHNSDPGGPGYNTQMGEMRLNFLPILEEAGVDLVLGGHSHSYERSLLINGHYGVSGTFSNTMVIQPGSGRETNGVGAYLKPDGLGESPVGNRGAIYAVAGSSGRLGGGTLNHPVMFTSQNVLGSMVLDFNSNRLDAIFLPTNGVPTDWFSIIKEGTYPPVATNAAALPEGGFEFNVLSRAYRTNIVEAAVSLTPPATWLPLATNVPVTSGFNFSDPGAASAPERYYRVRRP